MRITRISNHWLLEGDGFLTQNDERTIEERLFFKTIRVLEDDIDSFREATTAEIAEWEEYLASLE